MITPRWIAYVITCLLTLVCDLSYGNSIKSRPEINILTWWGYLDKPWVTEHLENTCKVKVSYDEYSTNEDFIRRLKEPNAAYDVVIFADTIYNVVKSEVTHKEPDITTTNLDYYIPEIKSRHIKLGYSKNIAYFAHSITLFLWNPALINLNAHDTFENIIQKSGDNLLVLIDDPAQTRLLTDKFTVNDFVHKIKNKNILISSDLRSFYSSQNVAAAYLWSGGALLNFINSPNRYKLLVHSKYSFFSSDLIAALNNRNATICVAKTMSSKEFLSKIQSETLYLSPYGNLSSIKNNEVRDFYKNLIENIENVQWMRSLTVKDYRSINKTWDWIKLKTQKQKQNRLDDVNIFQE